MRTPIRAEGDVLVQANSELICTTEGATPEELAHIVACINGMPPKITEATDEEVRLAQERHCFGSDDEIEIDVPARVSRGEDGAWVQAWVFVPKDLITNYTPD